MINDSELNNGELAVPEGVTELPDQAFAGREDIVSVYLPDSLRIIGMEAFAECPSLESVRLPVGLRDISPALFAECPRLRNIIIPKAAVSIGAGAFLNCESIADLSLPETLTEIGELAFWNTGIESVIVPKGVISIGESAFWSCEKLKRADVLGEDTSIGENAFGSCYSLIEGYIAPGYPAESDAPSELLYTLLWCSCPFRHSEKTSQRAARFIRENEELIVERIFKADNIPALTGLIKTGLLSGDKIEKYVKKAAAEGRTELTALFLKAQGTDRSIDEEFSL